MELFTFVESRQSYTRHKAIKDLEKPDFDVDEEKPCIWLVPAKPPPPFPPNPIRKRIEFPGTSKIIGCDRCEGVCRIPCVNCGGAGHKDCWNCNGDGVVKNSRTGIGLNWDYGGLTSVRVATWHINYAWNIRKRLRPCWWRFRSSKCPAKRCRSLFNLWRTWTRNVSSKQDSTDGGPGLIIFFRCMSCGGAAQIPCDKCLQQGKVREYEEILIEW